jgi:hypothetical protein
MSGRSDKISRVNLRDACSSACQHGAQLTLCGAQLTLCGAQLTLCGAQLTLSGSKVDASPLYVLGSVTNMASQPFSHENDRLPRNLVPAPIGWCGSWTISTIRMRITMHDFKTSHVTAVPCE